MKEWELSSETFSIKFLWKVSHVVSFVVQHTQRVGGSLTCLANRVKGPQGARSANSRAKREFANRRFELPGARSAPDEARLIYLNCKEAVNLRTPNYEWSPRPHFLC